MPVGSIRRHNHRPPPPNLPCRRPPAVPRRHLLPPLRLPRLPLRRQPNNPDAIGTMRNIRGFGSFAPSKRHGVIRVVKSRGRVMLDLPLTWSDLGDGSASLPYWPHMV